MTEEELRKNLAGNLAACRRAHGDTQLSLAEKLNYSDKSVSKWERGDGLPDIFVLHRIAEMYGVSIGDLIGDKEPEVTSRDQKRVLITVLSFGLVWLVAAITFLALLLAAPALQRHWLAFLFALPVSFIVLVVFSSLWAGNFLRFLAVTGLIWTLSLSVYLTAGIREMGFLFLIAGLATLLCAVWFFLRSGIRLRNLLKRLKPAPKTGTLKEEPEK